MNVLRYMFREGHPADAAWFLAGAFLLVLFIVALIRGILRGKKLNQPSESPTNLKK